MDMQDRHKKLMALAQEDGIYQAWFCSYQDAIAQFNEYANQQPREIQDILRGYAEGGRLMNQRLVNLACRNMRFPEENQPDPRF